MVSFWTFCLSKESFILGALFQHYFKYREMRKEWCEEDIDKRIKPETLLEKTRTEGT